MEPELYPRPDGTVYVCGLPQSDVPLPPSAAEVEVQLERCGELEAAAGLVSSALRGPHVEARQACYLPNSRDGLPLIGRWVGPCARGVGVRACACSWVQGMSWHSAAFACMSH